MAYGRILVPTDGSKYSAEAVEAAVELAKMAGGSITALHVIDGSYANTSRPDLFAAVAEILQKEGDEAVDYVKAECEKAGVPYDRIVVSGNPADVIIERSADFDIIVMSTLGKTGVTRFLIGSVAEKVVAASKCRVMTIRAQ